MISAFVVTGAASEEAANLRIRAEQT